MLYQLCQGKRVLFSSKNKLDVIFKHINMRSNNGRVIYKEVRV